jgi:hypothetical protein
MKNETAVEWFIEQIGEKQPNGLYVIDTLEDVVNVFAKAKEMEKEQIKDAHLSGLINPLKMEASKQAEQYYDEQYGN